MLYVLTAIWRQSTVDECVNDFNTDKDITWITIASTESDKLLKKETKEILKKKSQYHVIDIEDNTLKATTDKLEYGIKQINGEGFVYLMADDNKLHSRLSVLAKNTEHDFIIGNQIRKDGTLYCSASIPCPGRTDAGQLQNGVIVHEEDGQWARLLYEEAKNPLYCFRRFS